MPGMQDKVIKPMESPVFRSDPGRFVLFQLGKLREFSHGILEKFFDVEEYRFFVNGSRPIASTLGRVLKGKMDDCIAACETDIRNDPSVIGNEEAIEARVLRCVEDIRLLVAQSMAKI